MTIREDLFLPVNDPKHFFNTESMGFAEPLLTGCSSHMYKIDYCLVKGLVTLRSKIEALPDPLAVHCTSVPRSGDVNMTKFMADLFDILNYMPDEEADIARYNIKNIIRISTITGWDYYPTSLFVHFDHWGKSYSMQIAICRQSNVCNETSD